MENNRFKKIIKKIGLIGFIISLIFISYNVIRTIVKQPDQTRILETLKIEFNKINKLPNALVVNENYLCIVDKTSIDISYSTSSIDNDILKFYDEQLLKNGWILVDKKKIYDWGRDLGGKEFTYSKLDFIFSIYFSGDRSGAGWNYSVFLKMRK